MNENKSIFKFTDHFSGFIYEIRRDISFVKLHAINKADSRFSCLSFFNGDDAIFPNFLKCLGKQITNKRVIVCTNGTHLSDLFRATYLTRNLHEIIHSSCNALLNSTAYCCRVATGNDVAYSLTKNGSCQDSRSCGAITSKIRCLGGYFIDKFGTHVFKRVIKIDFFTDGDPVFCDGGATEAFVNYHIATGWSHGDGDSISELFNTL